MAFMLKNMLLYCPQFEGDFEVFRKRLGKKIDIRLNWERSRAVLLSVKRQENKPLLEIEVGEFEWIKRTS